MLRRGEAAFVDAILDGQPEPPLYFARMKRQNRDGVPALAALPTPRAFAPQELAHLPDGAVVIDTRPDRSAFMAAHVPGALYSPLNKQFNTIAGSYVTDTETPLVLLLPEARVEEAVRDLVRIGLDNVIGYATYETLAAYLQSDAETTTIPEVDFAAVLDRDENAVVLDVRRQAEVDAGHVPGSVHVPHTRLADQIDEVPEGEAVYVHCQSGARAAVAAAFVARSGREVVYVNDGFPHYRELAEAGAEVATGAASVVTA